MRIISRFHFFACVRFFSSLPALLAAIIIIAAVSDPATAQITKNFFVGARNENGLLTYYKGDPIDNEQISFRDKSFLTLKIDGKYYSNNPYGIKGPGSPPSSLSPDVQLLNGSAFKIGDTLRTVWKEGGFDIVQDAYPVQFSNSGVIVYSVKLVNYNVTPIECQAQYLYDNENVNTTGGPAASNDNPFIITQYGYVHNIWQDSPPNPIPSFFLAFEFSPDATFLGTTSITYANDIYTPRPLGLMQPALVDFGDWHVQGDYTWGVPNPADRAGIGDEATLIIGQSLEAGGAPETGKTSTTDVMRLAFGTPEWCFDHGNIVGFALYPQHIIWDPQAGTYTPNPFRVEAFLFPVGNNTASATTITQTVGSPIQVVTPKPSGAATVQTQNVGTITTGGFADVHWIDSVAVLQGGCAKSFPVDIHFDLTAGGVDQPVFKDPWDCTINIDCPNPDTLAPFFRNSFVGCDSIIYDTLTINDNRKFDLGLKDISYSSSDLASGQYSVTINPPPPYQCISTPVKIFVQQIDTFQAGHVDFAFTDCANNVSKESICFTAHRPIPDKTSPQFWLDTTIADCHAHCTQWTVTDSINGLTSIDRGVDSIVALTATNMTLSGTPANGKYPPGTQTATVHICVTDTMQDGLMILRANDTAHNARYDTVKYCTTPDALDPIEVNSPFDAANNLWHVHVTDSQAWDRGIDSVWIEQAGNVVTVPASLPYPVGCLRALDFDVKVVDATKCAHATVMTRDCVRHVSSPLLLTFTKGAKPTITAAKTVLCSDADAIQLDASGNFANYLWSTGETTKSITVHTPGSYTVTVDDGEGCTAASDPMTITKSVATSAIIPAGPVTLCEPDFVTLTADAGFASYQWMKNESPIGGATSQTFDAKTSGTYRAQVTNAAGCSGSSPNVTVTINPLPAQPVITSAGGVLTSTPAANYQWLQDGNPISGATSQTYTPTTGGNFSVKITDANGCSNISLPFSNAGSTLIGLPSMVMANQSDHITIPLSIVSSQSLPQSVNRGYTVFLRFNKTLLVPDGPFVSSTISGNERVVQYNGQSSIMQGVLQNIPFIAALGNDSCTTVTIDSFSWTTPGITVTTQNGNFCLSGLCKQGGTRLIDPEGKVSLSAPHPNPAFNIMQVDYELIEPGATSLVVYDMLGQEVLRLVDANQTPGTYSVSADITSLPVGSYIYSLRTPTVVKSHRLQIDR